MPIRNLERIFRPRSVAVIGASRREGSVGRTVYLNLTRGDFGGEVYPVNPKYESIDESRCYGDVSELPAPADLAVICTPAETVPDLVDQCGEAGILGLVIISAGFREAGEHGEALEREVLERAKRHSGLRIVGPNCLGVMAPHVGLNASFASDMPPRGNVAFISQSGALCTAVLDWSLAENVGFSHFVSVGNMLDVGIADLIDFFADDENTESIILYVESITWARQFMSAARAFTKQKPIIAYKAGRFSQSAQAAKSHTGSMAGVDSVYEAAFARAGVVRVFEMQDLFDCAELLARQTPPDGSRLAIVTNAGGPGVMATDALLQRQGTLAELSDETRRHLDEILPEAWSHGNPVDVLGDATPGRTAGAVEVVLAAEEVDGVLVILSPQAMTDPTGTAEAVISAASTSTKPVLGAWMGGGKMTAGIERFNEAGLPSYETPEKAVGAFMNLVTYARRRQVLYETPRELPVEFPLDRNKLRAVFDTILSEGQDVLTESTSKALLSAYEIPVTKTYVARSPEDAVELAHRVGFPVALKVFSPDITHKTDVGGVQLDVASDEQVQDAYERITASAREHEPEAQITGVTVQRMVTAPNARELIVGAKRDPVFGTVLLIGAGGVTAELYDDRALELPPLNERLVRRALESLRVWPLLSGFRGHEAVDIDRLIEVLIRFSYLVADYPEIVEFDVNPLLATPDSVVALDARIVLDHEAILNPPRPYSHLAIRPYPEELAKRSRLKDGTHVLLRPIKPEDEPMWHELLANCSPDTIRRRFRYMFKATTHEMATRFCFIDYDRELAIVAEVERDGERELIGVGRLIADVDHREAEYAVLVADPWQGIGLGSLLTDYCLDLCTQWGVERVVAETARDNRRMLEIFRKRGFQSDFDSDSDTVLLERTQTAGAPVGG